MSAAAAREMLYTQLAANASLHVFDHVPEKIDPPCVVIEPADDWISKGDTFGEVCVRQQVWALTPIGENSTDTDRLGDLVQAVLDTLGGTIGVTGTGKPDVVTYGEWLAYGVAISTEIYIKKGH